MPRTRIKVVMNNSRQLGRNLLHKGDLLIVGEVPEGVDPKKVLLPIIEQRTYIEILDPDAPGGTDADNLDVASTAVNELTAKLEEAEGKLAELTPRLVSYEKSITAESTRADAAEKAITAESARADAAEKAITAESARADAAEKANAELTERLDAATKEAAAPKTAKAGK